MKNPPLGILAILAASVVWGLSGLFYKALAHVPPLEVLSHRTLWSLLLFGIVLAIRGRLGAVWLVLKSRRTVAALVLAAVMISLNWGGYITSIQLGYALDASLGYYFFPLMVVLLGALFLGERFSRGQGWALGLMGLAVAVLTLGLGSPPWIALFLASTFGIYALIKKQVAAGPMVSVFVEVLLLAPLAIIWLFGAHQYGWATVPRPAGWFGNNWHDSVLLVLTGPMTAGPLMLFSFAAQRVRLSTVGLIQYMNPTLQFMVAAMVFGEPLTKWHGIALPLIWGALALYYFETKKREASAPKPPRGG
ncbi:MAG: EamA family transporter RarD [Rhodobacteraceae bacterium]|nr:EamA family transporter RarD [Paracoccaceae bacterium]